MPKKKGTFTKRQAEIAHAKKRAAQRYGLILNRHDHIAIVEQIQRGGSECIERQSNRVSIHLLTYNKTRFKVAYDRQRSSLITVLPLEDRPNYQPRIIFDENIPETLAEKEGLAS